MEIFESKSEIKPDVLQKFELVKSIGEECLNEDELLLLLKNKPQPVAYDGFEPSGRMHIAQGLIRSINVNKLLKAGCKFKFWIADWFALMNHKLGGDLKKIKKAGELMIETWRACGMDVENENIEFLWSSDEINNNPNKYWSIVLDLSTKFTLHRIKKCTQIMGREESDDLAASQIFYPVMQATDVFFLNVDICSLGVDQRKVNILCREYATKIKRKFKPVILSHHMIMGLDGSDKMSKSNPDNAIFMDDEAFEVKRKIKKAYCKPGEIDGNPILEYVKYIIFEIDSELLIERKEEYGGNKSYFDYDSLIKDYEKEELHPDDLKNSVIKCINKYLEPVREHFKTNIEAKKLLKTVKGFKITK
ncbi:tRNA synthetases class I (W and Y) [seawater metagenome]|uniref:tyrosine--tRNA ligase n=1 Tax=seawater metagenome TaxID=1561972 RepID=A0A5E8CL05_9ZZZZ